MDFDLVIGGGEVIDGSGRGRYRADLGIAGGRIAAVLRGGGLVGAETINAAGKVVAPGFVDVHSHADLVLLRPDQDTLLAPLLLQGITTFVGGNCGDSPAPRVEPSGERISMGRFLDRLEERGVPLNVALLTGHGQLRWAMMGRGPEAPSPGQLRSMQALLRESLEEGSFGFSIGMSYAPGVYAEYPEILALLRTTAAAGGLYATHDRTCRLVAGPEPLAPGQAPANVAAVREQLSLARDSGVRLQIAHLIFVGRNTWQTCDTVLADIDAALAEGLDVAFDAYPYTGGNTTIKVNFPRWFLADLDRNLGDARALDRLKAELEAHFGLIGRGWADIALMSGAAPEFVRFEGMDFDRIARELGLGEFEAYLHVARETRGAATIMQGAFSGDDRDETPLRKVLSHPRCAFMLDVLLAGEGRPNPGARGGFPRILGRYSRELGLFPLEEAVRRMTSLPAERAGLKDVGRIAEGCWADVTVFDPAKIIDRATPLHPEAPSEGIEAVLVSGCPAVRGGKLVAGAARRGRVLRRPGTR